MKAAVSQEEVNNENKLSRRVNTHTHTHGVVALSPHWPRSYSSAAANSFLSISCSDTFLRFCNLENQLFLLLLEETVAGDDPPRSSRQFLS